jgi:hypothetical protein
MPIRARAHVYDMQPYRPGKTPEQLMQSLGLSELIKLSANENPLGASPQAKEAILNALEMIHRYPDGACSILRDALSDFYGLPPDHFVFGNGSDELIHLFGVAYLEPGDGLMMGQPSFVRYIASAQLNQATLQAIPLTPDFRHDLEAMADAITERTKLVYIANPNNPTGTIVYRDELERFLERVPDHVLVILDEAYFEYVDHPDYPERAGLCAGGAECGGVPHLLEGVWAGGAARRLRRGQTRVVRPRRACARAVQCEHAGAGGCCCRATRPSACCPHPHAESRGAANVQRGVRATGAALCALAGELPAHRGGRPAAPRCSSGCSSAESWCARARCSACRPICA